MSGDRRPPASPHPQLTLASMLMVQITGSMCLAVPAVLAPILAPILEFAPERLGLYMAVAFLAAMASGLCSGSWVVAIGAVQMSQVALLALGLAVCSAVGGHGVTLLATAILLGAGYGMINPSAAILLSRNAPTGRRALYFSLKQAGVPVGIAFAGVTLPWALGSVGWQVTLLALGIACFAAAGLLAPLGKHLQPPHHRIAGGSNTKWAQALVAIFSEPHLRRLTVCAFVFEFVQLAVLTFLVSYLHFELGFPVPVAAGLLAASQAISTGARIGWGYVGDRWSRPRTILGALGLGAGLALVALGGIGFLPGASYDQGVAVRHLPPLLLGLAFGASALCAITTMSWNGVFHAELAHGVAAVRLPVITGATQTISFLGCVTGPLMFGEILRHGGSFSASFLILAPFPAAAGLYLLRTAGGIASSHAVGRDAVGL